MSIAAVIPARMASSRFPGKPLRKILGLPMVEHVRRRVLMCGALDEVIVATCDKEIADEIRRFGGKAVMTSDKHESCVDRVAEAALGLKSNIIINVQGDMPFVRPDSIEELAAPFLKDKSILFTDMMGPIDDEAEAASPNVVKVVADKEGNALYYSREPIPSPKKAPAGAPVKRFKQFGINAYRKESLLKFAALPRTYLEKIESVDMLRLLENGFKVRLVCSMHPVIGVDTPEDLESAAKLMENDPILPKYK